MLSVGIIILIIGLQIRTTLACNGYEIVTNKLTACDEETQNVTLTNFTVTLSDDCKLIPNGCVSYGAYTNVSMAYIIRKRNDLMPAYVFQGQTEGCRERTAFHADALAIMVALKVPTTCPVSAGKVCGESIIFADVNKFKQYLPKYEGRTLGQIELIFDSGVSCFKFDFVLQKKKKKPVMKKN